MAHLFHFLLMTVVSHELQAKVIHMRIRDGTLPLYQGTAYLECKVDGFDRNVYIYLAEISSTNAESLFATCSSLSCIGWSNTQKYKLTVSGNTVNIQIMSLDMGDNDKSWTCANEPNTDTVRLKVYHVPDSLILGGPELCDLGTSRCTFSCETASCTYPKPTFTWHYIDAEGRPLLLRLSDTGHTQATKHGSSCQSTTHIFKEELKLTQYTVFNNNVNKTVKLQCQITFTGFPSTTRQSNSSSLIVFAVKVSNVTIYDGQTPLQHGAILPVEEFLEKTLKCVPGFGNPLPPTHWYIGSIKQGSDPTFKFTPNNTLHNKEIFCEVANFPTYQMESAKPKLYVKVKIKNVYIEPASDSSLTVIQDTQEPVICATSGGRPSSSIKWLKLIDGRQENLGYSDSVVHSYTNSGLEVTKSTKNVSVSKQDSDWKLSCEASNFQKAAAIAANNSKSFNVLYPPERMSITQFEKIGAGSSIEVMRGSNVSLTCSADSNPPVDTFWWNYGPSTEGTITIDSIQNNLVINCTAENNMKTTSGNTISGFNSITKEIKVLYGPKIELIMFVDGIQKREETITVEENKSVSMRCQVDSNPVSDIILYRAAGIIYGPKTTTELVYNISSTLCKDNNRYTCRASNKIPDDNAYDEKGLHLNVKCSPTPVSGIVFSVPAAPNAPAVLSITFHAYPVPTNYTWFKNISNAWVQVTDNSSFDIANASLEFNLTIRNVKTENYGEYNLTVENGIGGPVSYIFILKHQGKQEFHEGGPGGQSSAALIGGVVGGLLLVCLVIIGVVYFLRRRTGFDGIKKKLFKSKSSALKEDTNQVEEGTQGGGYSYALVDKSKGQHNIKVIQSSNASGVTSQQDNGPCYENPMMLDVSGTKEKTPTELKNTKPKDKKKTSQTHDGLMYADLDFPDNTKSVNTKKKGTAGVKPKVSECVVYDAVQFGVVGEPFHEEEDSKTTK